MLAAVGLVLGTLVSEDLACVAAGLLIQRGAISPMVGVLSCTAGIFLGDCGLWVLGRLGARTAHTWPWLARHLSDARTGALKAALEQHAGTAILASRFLPGTRLPLYITAGWVRMSPVAFAGWTLVAVLLWTPALVLTAAGVGAVAGSALRPLYEWAGLIGGVGVLGLVQSARALAAPGSRRRHLPAVVRRVAARLARWRRWEFWPMWLFYAPVAAWIALLAVRYRGLSTITAANPGMPDGGTIGESKFEILSRLPVESTIPTALIPATSGETDRVTYAFETIGQRDWSFPLITKPDVGQRGAGVRLVAGRAGVADYLARVPGPVLMQPYHDGPFEAGVFYYRFPGWARGRILSITDKHFPVLIGDGHSTIEDLIWAHPRYRMQASIFLRRHKEAAGRVLERDEPFRLAVAGNHAQGTLFRDGAHLRTDALEARIDAIARSYPGFFIGRFDIRYRDVGAFMAGLDLAIVELNGATAESTTIYDPATSIVDAYRQLFTQWHLIFAIGADNRARGAHVSTTRRLIALLRTHLSTPPLPLSD